MTDGRPAYGLRPGTNTGPSCSGSPDFCFLCEFTGPTERVVGDTNFTEEIRQLVRHLADEKKELPTIVTAVGRAYDEGARKFVQWQAPTGETVDRPAWTRDAITRHLVYSTEFSLFEEAIAHIYQSLIVQEQAVVINPAGGVYPEAKAGLLKTIDSYANWLTKASKRKAPDAGMSSRAASKRAALQ